MPRRQRPDGDVDQDPQGWRGLDGFTLGSSWRPQTLSAVGPVIPSDIPPDPTAPNQTGLTRIAAQPDLPRPDWTPETRRLAVIS